MASLPISVSASKLARLSETTPLVWDSQKAAGSWAATLRLVGTAGAGLVADGYDLSVINIALAILTKLYPTSITATSQGLIASMTLVGVVVGQVIFGTVADIVGRRRASIATAVLIVGGAICSACVTDASGRGGISLQLMMCRLLLGLGIGGEYPLSAAISKEFGPRDLTLTRSQLLIMNMLMFNVGVVSQALLVLAMLSVGVNLEAVWRIALAMGAVPSTVAFVLRLQMHEPESVPCAAESVECATAGEHAKRHWHDLRDVLTSKSDVFVGACLSWMLFNFVGYSEGTFSSILCEQMLGKTGRSTFSIVWRDAAFVLILGVCMICGILVGFVVESKMSRCSLQFIGFAGLAATNLIDGHLIGVLPPDWSWVLILFFCVNAVAHALVGITTYLVPAESFPAAARGTCVGLAAASGKVGAAIGTGFFPTVQAKMGLGSVMSGCGSIMVVACVVTWRLTPRERHGKAGHCMVTGKSEEL